MKLETDLLAQFVNGDENAFQHIFKLFAKKVYHFIYRHLQLKPQAEDLTQEVFIKIWERRATIDVNKSFEGFIFTIASRMIIDYYRKNATKLSRSTECMGMDDIFVGTAFSDELLNRHDIESVYHKALLLLPPKRKEIFLLSRHQGLSNKEIAEQLGISLKTVENQMTAALATLRASFAGAEWLGLLIIFPYFV
ncbi:MAG TPA: RNA polymerase sigma-70 factor [Chitinophagaceae bacterium]|nr:RNA polymerase sigma-70 factor [Chitinophagaceae bacterium]